MRARGTGSIRKRAKGGYQVCYYRRGREVRESVARALRKPARAVTQQDAERLLQRRLREVAGNRYVGPVNERRTIREVVAAYSQHLEVRGKTLRPSHVDRILSAFGDLRAVDLRGSMVDAWAADMLADGLAPATANNGITYLKAALRLAHKHEQLDRVPHFSVLPVNNARQGFFEHHEFLAVLRHADPLTADLASFGYLTGARISEILALEWERVDRLHRTVTFMDTKNGDNRPIPLDSTDERGQWRHLDLWRVIERRWEARKVDGDTLATLVFHLGGRRFDYHHRWSKALIAAGFFRIEQPGTPDERTVLTKIFHDFRRTHVRNMTAASVPDVVGMRVTGHKTAGHYRRYNIVRDADLRLALTKGQTYLATTGSNVVEMKGATSGQAR